jgi:spermidine synthase
MRIRNYRWFIESLSPEEGHMHGIRRVLFSTQTRFQSLDIMELSRYGKALVLDGKVQSSLLDEFIYHEILVHPALLAHPAPRRVFIVGGGEGATVREVLRHRTVERVLMVDIDEEVVARCKEMLPEWHRGSFEDPRVEVRFMDARRYLEETDERFDAMVIDISEPLEESPAYLLFTKEFYEIVHARLTDGGIIALQAGPVSLPDLSFFAAIHQTLLTVFPVVAPYWACVPSFSLPWGFSVASRTSDPRTLAPAVVDRLIAERIGADELGYYDGETHQMSFFLPKHIRQRLHDEKRIIEDNSPFFIFT